MKRHHAYVVATLSAVVVMAGCSSTPKASFEDGWDWSMRSSAAYGLDAEFNRLTGEVTYEDEVGGTGLSLPSTTSPEPNALEAAIARAEEKACERYVDPYGDDPFRSQGIDIQFLMYDTIRAAQVSTYSDEHLAATKDVDTWLEEHGPSLEGVPLLSDEYERVSSERSALREERWNEKYPDLREKESANSEVWRDLSLNMFTSEHVREAQEFFIEQCGIEVSEGYEFPTPAELGITVDEEFVKQMEEARAESGNA